MDVRRWPRRGRPQGQPTRGKTTQNRLRRVDLFLAWYAPSLLRRHDGAFADAWLVDLGYGAEPFTTLEMAQRLRRLNPRLPVLGVEIDPERVAAALPYADDLTHFRRGGFNLPLTPRPDGTPETVRAIRAFNVLRQYDEAAVAAAYAELAHGVLPGGLLVEGTSDPLGRHWVANVLRRAADAPAWQPEALVFSTNFRGGWEPALFQAVLPKNLIHRMTPRRADLGAAGGVESGCAAKQCGAGVGAARLVRRRRGAAGRGGVAGAHAGAVGAGGVFGGGDDPPMAKN
jgi:hypothetical protein